MSKFLRTTLAVIVGTVIVNVLTFFFIVMTVGSLALFPEPAATVPSSCVLTVDMSKVAVTERMPDADLQGLLGGLMSDEVSQVMTLRDLEMSIRLAAEDPAVKYIFLKTDGLSVGTAQVAEIRQALQYFHDFSGKAIVAYVESPTASSYYLASVADKIYASSYEGSNMMLLGVSTQMIFLKDLLDRLGINVQLIRHGKYKSAGEMYTKSAPSAENMEQNRRMVLSLWENYSSQISEARGLEPGALDSFINDLKLTSSRDYELAGLVDGCMTKEELRSKLAELAGKRHFEDVAFVPVSEYAAARSVYISGQGTEEIAVLYAEGEIVEGNGNQNVAGDRFAGIIAGLRNDKNVKAVVLRVNSPGGSVLASEKIKSELDLLAQVKPLVASFGDVAASGGYWISAECEKIYASPTTLTGSIGVFSMVPDLSGTVKNFAHVNAVTVGSNAHSDMFSMMRPLDKVELAYMQRGVESVYDRFVEIVANGRNMTTEAVDAIAQGRVWTGSDAREIGLVDEFGTLEDAISYAMIAAGNPDPDAWRVASYPRALTLEESFSEMVSSPKGIDVVNAGIPYLQFSMAFTEWIGNVSRSKDFLFARMPFLPVVE